VIHPLLTPEIIAAIRQERHSNRLAEGGHGMCHYVTESLEHQYGWRRESGTYLSADGEIICGDGHYWNYLPDGSLLDPTADQFGEGYDIRVIAPQDPEFQRYRWAWTPDYHPDFPTGGYRGPYDYDVEKQLREQRGDYWWAPPEDLNVQIYVWRRQFYDDLYAARRAGATNPECTLADLGDLTTARYGHALPALETCAPLL
jgi:hypothetical protein